jgi:hypothetical protein
LKTMQEGDYYSQQAINSQAILARLKLSLQRRWIRSTGQLINKPVEYVMAWNMYRNI